MNNNQSPEISIILPCRNEEAALSRCLEQIKAVISQYRLNAEIIVSDSSSDRSPQIALQAGVILVKHDQPGYGRAYLEGLKVAKGKYIFMADSDGTYDFKEIPSFIEYLKVGDCDLAIGNRFSGRIEKGAMPWIHQYFGSPVLSLVFRTFFHTAIHDIHCGLRAISQTALRRLNLKTTGMEFASEMVVSAAVKKIKIKELPIDYYRRMGKSKLKTFRDGWRHLRFMLMYAPDYLFLIPGFLFLAAGLFLFLFLENHPVYGCFLIILGYQIISLAVFTKTYIQSIGFVESDWLVNWLAKFIKFETGIFLGLIFLLLSFLISQKLIFDLIATILGVSASSVIMLSLTIAIIGIQTMFSAFLISLMLIEKDRK